jgi:MFS family permease
MFFTLSGIGMINGVFLTCYVQELGGSTFHLSSIAALWCFSSFPMVLFSYVVDRIGHRKMVCVLTGILMGILGILLGATTGLSGIDRPTKIWGILSVVFLGHLISNFYFVAWFSWFPDFVLKERLGFFQSVRIFVITAASMLTSAIAGPILDLYTGGDLTGFRLIFTAGGIIGIVSVFPLLKIPERPAKPKQAKEFLRTMRTLIGHRDFLRFFVFLVCMNVARLIIGVFPTVFMRTVLEIPYSYLGLYAALPAVGSLGATLFWGRLADRYGGRRGMMFSAGGMIFVPLLWAMNWKGHYTILPIAQLISGIAGSAFSVSWVPLMYRIIPEETTSLAASLTFLGWGIAGFLSPFIGGQIIERFVDVRWMIGSAELGSIHLLFIIQFGLSLLCFPLVTILREPGMKIESG